MAITRLSSSLPTQDLMSQELPAVNSAKSKLVALDDKISQLWSQYDQSICMGSPSSNISQKLADTALTMQDEINKYKALLQIKDIMYFEDRVTASLQQLETEGERVDLPKIAQEEEVSPKTIDYSNPVKAIEQIAAETNQDKKVGFFSTLLSRFFKVQNVASDGNCGIRAIIRNLNPEISKAQENEQQKTLRENLVVHMEVNRPDFEPFCVFDPANPHSDNSIDFDGYLKSIGTPNTFISEQEVRAFSDILQKPIWVYREGAVEWNEKEQTLEPKDSLRYGKQYPGEPVRLYYMGEHYKHYQALLSK